MPADNKLVIIVEDEPDTAEMFAELMRLEGYQIKKAYGGTAAIDLLTKETPYVVLLDIMMPDVSGLEVLRYMRRDPQLENIPVVVISGRPKPDEIINDLENSATVYVMKPIGVEQILSAIAEAVDKSSKPR
ncbi:MAG: response regulator [Anaerolineales bacterium]|jgi:CheY-like chemotaxis protein